MDDKAYTCFYCHSILPYEVCISGTHFCLQATNAIEFWGNVVKIASTNSDQELSGEAAADDLEEDIKQDMEIQQQHDMEGTEEELSELSENISIDTSKFRGRLEDSFLECQEGDSDVKPMTWRLKMIALIKQRPPLYDKRLPLAERTFPIRAKLWNEVYEGLNGLVPIELLPKRFKVLRDRYNKELKKRRLGYPIRKHWSLFKYLDFLSNTKKKICIRKFNLSANSDYKLEEDDDTDSLMRSSDKSGAIGGSSVDEDLQEDLELKRKLVELVGERPPLYDCRLPRHVRVAENKVKLWQQVYQALGGVVPLVDLPRKFKSLRDRYMKEKRKILAGEASDWPLMESMTYLDSLANIRPQDVNTSLQTSNESTNNEEKKEAVADPERNQGETIADLAMLPNKSPAASQVIIVPHDGQDHQDVENEPEALLAALSERNSELPNDKNSSSSKENLNSFSNKLKKLKLLEYYEDWSEDDFFGAYLVKLMKKLPLEDKLKLHIDIINMIKQNIHQRDIETVKNQLLD